MYQVKIVNCVQYRHIMTVHNDTNVFYINICPSAPLQQMYRYRNKKTEPILYCTLLFIFILYTSATTYSRKLQYRLFVIFLHTCCCWPPPLMYRRTICVDIQLSQIICTVCVLYSVQYIQYSKRIPVPVPVHACLFMFNQQNLLCRYKKKLIYQ